MRQLHRLPLGAACETVHLEEVQEVQGGEVLQQGLPGGALGACTPAPLQEAEASLNYLCWPLLTPSLSLVRAAGGHHGDADHCHPADPLQDAPVWPPCLGPT